METVRRYVGFIVPFHALLDMITEGNAFSVTCISGVPKDAKFVSSHEDPPRGCVVLVFEHESFPLVPMGSMMPYQQISFEITNNA